MKQLLCALALACTVTFFSSAQNQQMRVDVIDFFGVSGINLAQLRAALPIQIGSTLTLDKMREAKEQLSEAVARTTGRNPTDVAMVCCTDKGSAMIYIGLQGKSYRPFIYSTAPTGTDKLPQQGLDAYKKAEDSLQHAVESGQSKENDSTGYALMSDPTEHAAELDMREYAIHHEDLIRQVLATSSDVPSRQAASELLGYANQSQAQIDALVAAARDPDGEVRNNSVRALGVLAKSNAAIAAKIPTDGFIAMLNSGIWTDRNKGGLLLEELTSLRDPKVLRKIDLQAHDSLIEMSRWHDAGHAYVYRVLLGRIAGIEEKHLQALAWDNAQIETIISALPASR